MEPPDVDTLLASRTDVNIAGLVYLGTSLSRT
jgi:hypothetical protein